MKLLFKTKMEVGGFSTIVSSSNEISMGESFVEPILETQDVRLRGTVFDNFFSVILLELYFFG